MQRSPLYELQRSMDASFGETLGWELPRVFSNALDEYRAATRGVALLDATYTGRLKAQGKDALDLVNRLSTNKLDDLSLGQARSTVITSNKGRILELLTVVRMESHLLLLTSPQNRHKVMEWIDRYTFLEEVSIEDITDRTVMLSLLGPQSPLLLQEITGEEIKDLPLHSCTSSRFEDIDITVIRTEWGDIPGYDLVMQANDGEKAWQTLLQRGAGLGVKPIGLDTLEVIRVELGIPLYGRELSEKFNPLEANLRHSVSFNKGCYIGQEVVTRLNTYKKVQKHLMGLIMETDALAQPNAKLVEDGQEVGFVTSPVNSLSLGRPIALAYVKAMYARPGIRVRVALEHGDAMAELVELPFKTSNSSPN